MFSLKDLERSFKALRVAFLDKLFLLDFSKNRL